MDDDPRKVSISNVVEKYNDTIPNVYKLKNGLIVSHIQAPCKGLFRIELIVRAGSLEETPKQIGFAHFIEHLMSFFPSDWYPNSIQNQQEINRRGIQMNAWTSESTVGYWMEGLDMYTDLMTTLVLRNFTNPVIKPDKEIFKQEKNAVVSELFAIINDAWYNLNQMIEFVQYKGTNLEYTVEYEKDNVRNCAIPENVMEWRNQYYKPELTSIIIISNKTEVEVKEYIHWIVDNFFPDCYDMTEQAVPINFCNFSTDDDCKKHRRNYSTFGKLNRSSFGKYKITYIPLHDCKNDTYNININMIPPPQEEKPSIETITEEEAIDRGLIKSEEEPESEYSEGMDLAKYRLFYIYPDSSSETVKIEFHFPIPFDSFDKKVYALNMIDLVLSNGLGSRLYFALRTTLGAVYHVFSGSSIDSMDNKLSQYIIETETSINKAKDVVDFILVELQLLIDENEGEDYITENEWQQYNDTIGMGDEMDNCSVTYNKHYNFYHENLIWGKPMKTIKQIMKERKKIIKDKDEVLRVAKEVLDPTKLCIFYSGPEPILLSENNKDTHIIMQYKNFEKTLPCEKKKEE